MVSGISILHTSYRLCSVTFSALHRSNFNLGTIRARARSRSRAKAKARARARAKARAKG